ncbi:UDP-GlcNAc:betaGal beta-1,3-N-acetylglucosaminyltransferase-like protein 1 isoform B [Patagioenas fasciata monilis]|uniref:UDP-GlcNAc:betaGal beta-1,3-N-acetylglucosaminyltransferase-like protein 1 isoform B n=1 Tax=Patagioenas fasciata monilis TaxID=372326 RepID=A0A1V4KWN3_PATFA|nr:UDP-GlcNAc:betaGal beta-1,3-N-acetylglucosaminyltransferase-like protein 1 isoform B [Patagioenas fasciata monilis]
MAEAGRAGGSSAATRRPVPRRAAGRGCAVQVSVIVPVHNSECWLDQCLKSVWDQDFKETMELSVFNDASKDGSAEIIEKWKIKLEDAGVPVIVGSNDSSQPRGVGFAKNQAVIQSSGTYLCFLDSDDVMMPQRVRLQHEAAIQHPNSIIGCQVRREPVDSTERYTRWINNLTEEQLLTQEQGSLAYQILKFQAKDSPRVGGKEVFTSHGPTVIMPTWFCSREWFFHVGKFDEGGKGVPEDLLFFYKHIQMGGEVFRVNHCLLLYRYHPQAATHAVLEGTIWNHRVRFLEDRVLSSWTSFTIWNAGKQGKKLYRSLSPANQKKVTAFCDVDEKKIAKGFYTYEESEERPKPKIPICHFRNATPPFIICVKLDLTGGTFEANLSMLNLQEGVDYYHFN